VAVACTDDRTLAIGQPWEELGWVVDVGSLQIVWVGQSQLPFPPPILSEKLPRHSSRGPRDFLTVPGQRLGVRHLQ
jgi:hypothetical protein